ncbi:MAG: hypothetical protein K6C36_04500 [Clostridia bacterium]|nr:hypothetical protein [Clostridia bacterium]
MTAEEVFAETKRLRPGGADRARVRTEIQRLELFLQWALEGIGAVFAPTADLGGELALKAPHDRLYTLACVNTIDEEEENRELYEASRKRLREGLEGFFASAVQAKYEVRD